MDPRKIVSRNRNWWNVKSSRHEYELVGASEVLERSRFEDDRPLVGFLFCFSFVEIDTHKYNNTDTKDQSICQKTYDTMRNSRNNRVDRCVFYSDLFLDRYDTRGSIGSFHRIKLHSSRIERSLSVRVERLCL